MKQINNTIKITCNTSEELSVSELVEFQGDLKQRTDEDVNRIVKSIKKHGFTVPFFVWKHDDINHVLDGHGRLLALQKLDTLGYLIPPLPVVYIECKDELDAREKLLQINSHYGKMTKESVLDFIGDFEIDVANFNLPCGTINFDEIEPIDFGDEPNTDDKKVSELGVLVKCDSEAEMEQTFMQLKNMGFNCRTTEY